MVIIAFILGFLFSCYGAAKSVQYNNNLGGD